MQTKTDGNTQTINIEMTQYGKDDDADIEVSSWRFNKLTTTYYADVNSRRSDPPTSMSSSSLSLLFTLSSNVFFL